MPHPSLRPAIDPCISNRFEIEHVPCNGCGDTFSVPLRLLNLGGASFSPVACPRCGIHVGSQCGQCGAFTLVENLTHSVTLGRDVCQVCFQTSLASCNYCGRELRSNRSNTFNGHQHCNRCYNELYFTCPRCDTIEERQHAHRYGDEIICENCFQENYVVCNHCGESVYSEDAIENDNGTFCPRCERQSAVWEPNQFSVAAPTYDRIVSRRQFGVELETARCADHRELRELSSFGSKTDPSIEGMEFISPILYGDQGLAEIDVLCNFATRKRWLVNRYCGYHVHFDMRAETPATLKRIAYAYALTHTLWTHFVSNTRANSPYAGPPDYTPEQVWAIDTSDNEEWDYFVGARDRFEYANWRAYLSHGTFEIRLYEGTLDSVEITNWLKLHALFIDAIAQMDLDDIRIKFETSVITQFANLSEIVGSELASYWNNKAAAHGKRIGTPITICAIAPPF